jgi:ribonuclease HII
MLKVFKSNKIVAGCDEAGRGCLAGPVVAASVILPKYYKNNLIKDSKKLSKNDREILQKSIKKEAICWSIGIVNEKKIDEINILNASFLAMHKAISSLKIAPGLLLIDGNRFNSYPNINHECIIKGDAKYLSIAAASILAKTYRDNLMNKLDVKHPQYGWKDNKGYPTKKHKLAINKIGICQHHRKSFQLFNMQTKLDI